MNGPHLVGLPPSLFVRLSVMLFLQFAVLGSWSVPLPTWLMTRADLGGLGFTDTQVFWAYGFSLAVGGIAAPLLNSVLADRLFHADRLLAALDFLGAGLLAAVAAVADHHAPLIHAAGPEGVRAAADAAFVPLCVLLFAYNAIAGMVALTLATTLCMRHMPDADRQYPAVRIWGTVGWIAAGVVVGTLTNALSPQPLWLAAGLSLVAGFFALALPATPPVKAPRSLADTLGLPAVGMFARGPLLVFAVCGVLATLLNSFYNVAFNKFLTDLHLPSPTSLMSIGQVSEVVFMALIPAALARFGLRWVMIVGLAGWMLRYLVFLTGNPILIVGIGIPLHGFSHAFYFVAAMPFVDRQAPRHLRAAAQGMLTFLIMGLGLLPGTWLVGVVLGMCRGEAGIDWPAVWSVPATLALFTLSGFAAFFHVPRAIATRPDDPVAAPPAVEAGEPA